MTRYINPCSVQFKIDKIIWKAFKSVCYYQNLETSFVLREFVKDYVTNRREIEKRERAKILGEELEKRDMKEVKENQRKIEEKENKLWENLHFVENKEGQILDQIKKEKDQIEKQKEEQERDREIQKIVKKEKREEEKNEKISGEYSPYLHEEEDDW